MYKILCKLDNLKKLQFINNVAYKKNKILNQYNLFRQQSNIFKIIRNNYLYLY